MISRRRFVAVVGLILACRPFSATAQARSPRKIGLLMPTSADPRPIDDQPGALLL
jgi:hypothetical protein